MMSVGIPKRRVSILKTMKGMSNVNTRLGEEIKGATVKLVRCSVEK